MQRFPTREENIRRKEDILSRYPNLIAFVEEDLHVKPASVHGNYAMFHCWAHKDRTPSLRVKQHGFTCFSAACGMHGNLFGWVGWRNNLDPHINEDYFKILDLLDGGNYSPGPVEQYAQNSSGDTKKKAISPQKVLRDHAKLPDAMRYFGKRGVSEAIARQFYLGARLPFSLPYEFLNGKTVWIDHNRYAIPTCRGDLRSAHGKVLAVAMRYDDDEIYHTFYQFCDEQYDLCRAIRRDLEQRALAAHQQYGEPMPDFDDPKTMIDALYRRKYHNLGGVSSMFTYNADLLVDPITNVRIPHELCFVVEGQIDCQAMVSNGYPTVAVPQNNRLNIAWLFEKVKRVVVIADNDGEAGKARARWLINRLNKPRDAVRALIPPHGKDAADECTSGMIHKWLGVYGYEPTLPISI